MALLGKWKWRLGRDEPGLWKEVLLSKYGSWRALDRGIDGNYDSWWWRDIGKICGGRQITSWFDRNIIWKTRIGNKIKFWEDRWADETPLRDSFPRMYTNSILKEATMEEMGVWNGD